MTFQVFAIRNCFILYGLRNLHLKRVHAWTDRRVPKAESLRVGKISRFFSFLVGETDKYVVSVKFGENFC